MADSAVIGCAAPHEHQRSSKYFHNSGRSSPIYGILITINIGSRAVIAAPRAEAPMQSQYWFTGCSPTRTRTMRNRRGLQVQQFAGSHEKMAWAIRLLVYRRTLMGNAVLEGCRWIWESWRNWWANKTELNIIYCSPIFGSYLLEKCTLLMYWNLLYCYVQN